MVLAIRSETQNQFGGPTSFSRKVYTNIQQHDKVLSVQQHYMLCSRFLGRIFVRNEIFVFEVS
jgi:hypothetical protein